MNKKLRIVLIVLFAVVFCVSSFMAGRDILRGKREQSAFDALAKQFHALQPTASANGTTDAAPAAAPASTPAATPSGTASASVEAPAEEPEATGIDENARRQAMLNLNPDYFGWITIEGTTVDYPVMFTPNVPQKYLHRSFEGEYSYSGVPFVDECWEQKNNLYLIYGHNMKNGAMFGCLLEYADKSYFEEHPTIYFSTLYDEGNYEIYGAFYSRDYPAGVSGFRYYEYTDLSSEARFDEFVKKVAKERQYDTGVTPEYGDRFIMLSTCSYHVENGRFVVIAVCKQAEKQ